MGLGMEMLFRLGFAFALVGLFATIAGFVCTVGSVPIGNAIGLIGVGVGLVIILYPKRLAP